MKSNPNNNIIPDASKDQHILIDDDILDTMVVLANITPNDTVLEIGSGPGNLTEKILKYKCNIIAIEKDKKYVEVLKEKYSNTKNINIILGNVLNLDLPFFNKIISNIPYSISEPLFLKLMKERKYKFDIAVMTLSERFVKRIIASPFCPLFGVTSALFMAFFNVKIIKMVPKNSFYPPPRVNSYCVKIIPRQITPTAENRVPFIIQKLFLYDEKKIKNSLIQIFWDYGENLFGVKLTKKQVKSVINSIFEEEVFDKFKDKKISNISNQEMKTMVTSLLCWDFYDRYGIKF